MILHKVTELFKDNEKVALVLLDNSSPNISYIGRNHNPKALETDETWQIIRVLDPGNSTVIKIEFANGGAFNASWNARTSLFPPTGPLTPPISGLVGIVPASYKGFTITLTSFNEPHEIEYFADAAKTISLGKVTYEYNASNILIGGTYT